MSDVGRNDPCPCGSGKKYKKCCFNKGILKIGNEEWIRKRHIPNILRFCERYLKNEINIAYEMFWDEFDPESCLDSDRIELADINFMDWFIHDWVVDSEIGNFVVDIYIAENKKLNEDEILFFEKMKSSVISLYEIQKISEGENILLKDLIRGGKYKLEEMMPQMPFEDGVIIATRIIEIDGKHHFSGCIYPFPMDEKENIIEFVNDALEDYRELLPGNTVTDFLEDNGEIFNKYWYVYWFDNNKPKIVTTDGEEFVLSKAHFGIKNKKTLINGLKNVKDFTEDKKDIYVWLGESEDENSAPLLGTIRIKGKKLILETNSKERLEKGKNIIQKHLSDSVTYKLDSFQDPYRAAETVDEELKQIIEDKIPMEIQKDFHADFMKKHYEKWLTDEIPALNDQIPLAAVKTKEGRKKVTDLLNYIEEIEERKRRAGELSYDISWLWERLGLKR